MASSDVQRKLTVILVSDVVGYSRLMGDDPEGTLRTLTEYRKVFSDKIGQYNGRVVNAPGDSLLAEFGSVLDAVSCAVDVQRELAERNQDLPDPRRMDFRIGVTLGDVLVKEEALYGDGVNIAARLESLAEPGGIYISGKAHTEVKNRLPLHFEYLGEQAVKNIAEPVKVYQVLSKPGSAAHRVVRAKRGVVRVWKKAALAVVVMLLVVGGGFLGWNYYEQRSAEAALAAFKQSAAFPLPDKPSIAVLPFQNLSDNPKLDYLGDGISEDVTTALAKSPLLFVMARNSAFRYKGKANDIQEIGRALGVRYILEGSVQAAGARLRVTAQLIDAATGRHLWADNYDRDQNDLFEIRDEIVKNIVTALDVKLLQGEEERERADTTKNFKAWQLYREGISLFRKFRKEDNQQAKKLFEQAFRLDSGFSAARLKIGWVHTFDVAFRWTENPREALEKAENLARTVLRENDSFADAHSLMGFVFDLEKKPDRALASHEKAVSLLPNGVTARIFLGRNLFRRGRFEESVQHLEAAARLSPSPPPGVHRLIGVAHYLEGRFEVAIEMFKKRKNLPWMPTLLICAAYAGAGKVKEANEYKAIYMRDFPGKFEQHRKFFSRFLLNPTAVQRILDDLAKVGLK